MEMIRGQLENEKKNICAKRIRLERMKLRGRNGILTQSELADMIREQGCPMNRITVSRIESGAREINDFELIHFAYALGVDVRYLLCGRKTVAEVIFEHKSALGEDHAAGA